MKQGPIEPADQLIGELRARGIELWRVGDRLRYRPREAMSADLAERVVAAKPALLVKLTEQFVKVNWAEDARRFIALIPDESLRPTLTDLYEETAAFIEFEQNRPREEAEQQAFGLLLFHAIRHGVGSEPQ